MKKIFLLAAAVMMSVAMMAAKKTVVYVEYFSYATSVGEATTEQVRSEVIAGLSKISNLTIVDVASQNSLRVEDNRRSSEANMADETSRVGIMKQLGAQYIIQGYVSSFTMDKVKDENGKVTYYGGLNYTLKIINTEDGSLVDTKTYNYVKGQLANTVLGSSESAARATTLDNIKPDMKVLATKNFKVAATIAASDYETDKKGKQMTTCYVTAGSEDGVSEKTKFIVSKAKVVVGTVTWVEIGELQVTTVAAPGLSQCKVTKGGAEILNAMKEYLSQKDADPEHAYELKVVTNEANESAEKAKSFFEGLVK